MEGGIRVVHTDREAQALGADHPWDHDFEERTQNEQDRWTARWAGFDHVPGKYWEMDENGFNDRLGDVGGFYNRIIDTDWVSDSGWGS